MNQRRFIGICHPSAQWAPRVVWSGFCIWLYFSWFLLAELSSVLAFLETDFLLARWALPAPSNEGPSLNEVLHSVGAILCGSPSLNQTPQPEGRECFVWAGLIRCWLPLWLRTVPRCRTAPRCHAVPRCHADSRCRTVPRWLGGLRCIEMPSPSNRANEKRTWKDFDPPRGDLL